MASYTTNYQLHQWEANDDFLRTDFNEDFAKIDAAIKGVETAANTALAGKASQMALEAVEAMASGKAEFTLGTYIGNGSNKTVSVGFRAKALFICDGTYDTLLVQGGDHPLLSLTDSGFSVKYISAYGSTPNKENSLYAFLAFR